MTGETGQPCTCLAEETLNNLLSKTPVTHDKKNLSMPEPKIFPSVQSWKTLKIKKRIRHVAVFGN